MKQINKFIRHSIFQIFRWQTGVKSRNPFRDAVYVFTFFCMMLSLALFIAVDSLIGLGLIKYGMIGILLASFILDIILNKEIRKIGIQGLTDEFLKDVFLMNRKEKLIYELIALFCILSPFISMLLFIEKA